MKTSSVIFLFIVIPFLFPQQAIRIDGTMAKGEWDKAKRFALSDSATIFITQDKGNLYVAVKSAQPFWGHLYLSNGKVTSVMHVSAALDDVTYTNEGNLWRTNDTFIYEMRDREYTPETERKIDAYFERNRWVANNLTLGQKTFVEAKISLDKLEGDLFFACAIAGYDMTLHAFPASTGDDIVRTKLVQGYAIDSLNFKPSLWHPISR
jgi:hypothetical protein